LIAYSIICLIQSLHVYSGLLPISSKIFFRTMHFLSKYIIKNSEQSEHRLLCTPVGRIGPCEHSIFHFQ
jgi:hypothetical protein